MNPELLLVLHAAATWAMVGLIWFVQVVHYPLFKDVGRETYPEYQRRHMNRTTPVVAGFMLPEAALSMALLVRPPDGVPYALIVAGVILLIVVWAATALYSVPVHGHLTDGFDAHLHRKLVTTNWIRTFAWTARGVIAAVMLVL